MIDQDKEKIRAWMKETNYAGYNRFEHATETTVRCVSGLLDGTGDHFAAYSVIKKKMVQDLLARTVGGLITAGA